MMLAVLVAILAPLILRLPPVTSMQLMSRQGPTAAGLLVRWVFLLVTLLFIGYLTKFSAEFSRRVILTWAAGHAGAADPVQPGRSTR